MNHLLLILSAMALLAVTSASGQDAPSTAPATRPARANLGIVATPSASFVSGHERLGGINDGRTPRNSRDASGGAYGNWPQRGTQWVQYDWPVEIATDGVEIYWYIDGRGLAAPAAARLMYWSGTDWSSVPGEIGLEPDRFNVLEFDEIRTTKLRLEIDARGESSTGVVEWRVRDSGNSPDFPPILDAGPDRIVVENGRTWLHGRVRGTGKPGVEEMAIWVKAAGPGEVRFDDADSLDTAATFSAPGEYTISLQASAGSLTSEDTVTVRVEPRLEIADVEPIPTGRYTIDSTFWNPRIKATIVNWIPHCIAQIDKPDLKEGGMNNIIQAGNKLAGKEYEKHIGYPFSNAWVLNTIEAMSLAQMVDAGGDAEILAAQEAMRSKLEEWIPLLLAAQEPDGYFQTRFTLGTVRDGDRTPERWSPRYRTEHEGYVAGYFIEAAIAHFRSTDGQDRRLYDAAKKLADCWEQNIGPAPKQDWYDGHQGMEIALFRFADLVDEVEGEGQGAKYADLARFLLDRRGTAQEGPDAHYGLGSDYHQSHLPVTQQYSVVGHAVRAVYTYAAMADAMKRSDDADYQSAVRSLWDNLVNRKYYVTGGVGSGESAEGFGGDYSLPNRAYCESCSGAGLIFFQHRMNTAFGHSRYADLYEETLYNAVLSDLDLEGRNFTYTNALDTDDERYPWHVCPCCVGNIPRTLLSLPTWAYAKYDEGIYVNLFIGGTMRVENVGGRDVELVQKTDYPWEGAVAITVNPSEAGNFALRIRVPDRSVSEIYSATPKADGLLSLRVNGRPFATRINNGYAVIERDWNHGDRVEFLLPLAVQKVHAIDQVEATRGRVALRYGPLIYNIESVDQDLTKAVAPGARFTAEWMPDLLGGVIAIRGTFADGSAVLAIPNYARNNRGGRSIVWIREEE